VKTAVSASAVGPRGEKHGQLDATHQKGITADRCAAAILQAVERRRDEIYVGGWEVAGIHLKRFAPWLISRMVRRMKFSVDARS
jgi:hypothetical protein